MNHPRPHNRDPSAGNQFRRRDAIHGRVEQGSKGSLSGLSPVPGKVPETDRLDVHRPESPHRQQVAKPVPRQQGAKPVLRLQTPRNMPRNIMQEDVADNGVKPPEEKKHRPVAGAIPRNGSPLAHSLSGTKHPQGREREPLIAYGGGTSNPDRSSRSNTPTRQGSLRTNSPSSLRSARQPLQASIDDEEDFAQPDSYALEVAARSEDQSDSRLEDSDNASLGGRGRIRVDKHDSAASSLRTASISTATSSTQLRPSKFIENECFTLSSPITGKAVVTSSSSPIPKKTANKDRPTWRNFFKRNKREEATQPPDRQTQRKDGPASRGKKSGRVKIVNASGFPAIEVVRKTSFEKQLTEWEEEQIRSGNGWKVV